MKVQPIIDVREREQIRLALNAYKAGHGFGVPSLHKRMLRILDCLDSELPLPTLQRFLRGKHRTDDGMVRRYKKFLELAAPTPPYAMMGEAIAQFFAEASRIPRAAMHKTLTRRFARHYLCYAKGKCRYERGVELPGFPRNADKTESGAAFQIPYAAFEFEPLSGTPFLRVTEWVYNRDRKPLITEYRRIIWEKTKEGHEGVLTMVRHWSFSMMVLRSVQANEPPKPRIYMIFPPGESLLMGSDDVKHRPLEGVCVRTRTYGAAPSVFESFQVRLYPVPDGGVTSL